MSTTLTRATVARAATSGHGAPRNFSKTRKIATPAITLTKFVKAQNAILGVFLRHRGFVLCGTHLDLEVVVGWSLTVRGVAIPSP